MSKEDTYRRNAVEFAELAHRATSVADRAHMFRSAEAWLDLVLLRHKFLREFRVKLRAHAGHRGSRAWPIA